MCEQTYEKNVFINCPFDEKYIPLLRPMLFTVLMLGFEPRIASERKSSNEQRIDKIRELIRDSKYSIHDLSRMQANKQGEYARMNMPFELGLDFGCKEYGQEKHCEKKCLVLDKDPYRYQKALSDISGSDISSHSNEPRKLVGVLRNWFIENGSRVTIPSPTVIWDKFNTFMADYYLKRSDEGFSKNDLQIMSTKEVIGFMRMWLSLKTSS
ncbi:MAG: hypothetical protein ACTSYJ_01240 [Candidatus Thorarchaeota archaeon]